MAFDGINRRSGSVSCCDIAREEDGVNISEDLATDRLPGLRGVRDSPVYQRLLRCPPGLGFGE